MDPEAAKLLGKLIGAGIACIGMGGAGVGVGVIFGNYLSGYLGTYYEKMPKNMFFLMLTVLGVGAGAAIFALQRPLKNAIGDDV